MYKIAITENTYRFLKNNNFFLFLEQIKSLKCEKNGTEYTVFFKLGTDNVNDIYRLVSLIYKEKPNENNRWIFNGKEQLLSDEEAIRFFLLAFEGTDDYPLSRDILSDIIRDDKIHSMQELRNLMYKPFSGILAFNQLDMLNTMNVQSKAVPKYIKIEHVDICIKNRYIASDLELHKGKINFSNCILEGNIIINSAAEVHFHQCIITGKVECSDISYAYFSSSNAKQLMIYNSNLDILRIEHCKVYRLVIHSCSLDKIFVCHNKFVEPYIANLNIQNTNIRIDMSQFIAKNINKRIITRISKNKPISIKKENDFYLTFMFRNPVATITPNEISYDMVNTILSYGDLDKTHNLYSDMKYKKSLYSNTKWRRLFVYLTGAFYIPSRWILYLVLSTVVFTVLYAAFPAIQFANIITNNIEQLDLWTALYYSTFQIIGSNPTVFTPIGTSQICTAIQSLLNTVLITNLFASIIKKYIRDEK